MIEISIIIPVYNAEQYLNRCINSILNQAFSSYEIILIDDGSSDRSLEMCYWWEKKDSRIRVFHQENKGAGAARNMGLQHAKGKYIQFIDSDDTIKENCLEELYKLIEKYDSPDLIEFRLNYIGLNGYRNTQGTVLKSGLYDNKFIKKKFLPVMMKIEQNENIYYNIFNVLRIIKRELILNNKIQFNQKIRKWEDWVFAIELYYNANEMVVTDKSLYNYYGHIDGGLGGKYDPNTFDYIIESYRTLEAIMGLEYNFYSQYAMVEKANQIERCLYEICSNETKQKRIKMIEKILKNRFTYLVVEKCNYKKDISLLRPILLNNHYWLSTRLVNLYFKMKQIKRGFVNNFYHK